MANLMDIPRPDAGTLTGSPLPTSQGVGIAGQGTIGDQFSTLVAHWNEARYLAKPAAVRAMMMLRQRGQGGAFDTEKDALKARMDAESAMADKSQVDYEIDVVNAGFNAFQTLSIRARFPGSLAGPMPDLTKFPPPAADLNHSEEPQPFTEWVRVGAQFGEVTGVGSQWEPTPDDRKEVGATWQGLAKHTTSAGVYTKMRFVQNAVYYDRWVRTA